MLGHSGTETHPIGTPGPRNDLKNQFDTLGLDTGMIMKYVSQAQQYLDTPQGQEAKTMLTDAFAKWVS